MKYPKPLICLYVLSGLKILFTVIFMSGVLPVEMAFLTVSAVPICLAMSFYEGLTLVCLALLVIVCLTWLLAIFLFIAGIYKTKLRMWSALLFTIAFGIDGICAFFAKNLFIQVSGVAFSVVLILIGMKSIFGSMKTVEG